MTVKVNTYQRKLPNRRPPFVQSCVLCGEHKRFLHDPQLTGCPTCASPYCKRCYRNLPKIKVGLFRKEPQCPRCVAGSGQARAPYGPYTPQIYQPPPVIFQMPAQQQIITREVVKHSCRYCGTVNQGSKFCIGCGAPA